MGNIPNLPFILQGLFYVCCLSFSVCVVLGVWYGVLRKDGETASTLFAIAVLSIFALLPYLVSGSLMVQSVGLPK
jgi:hypothetical protein